MPVPLPHDADDYNPLDAGTGAPRTPDMATPRLPRSEADLCSDRELGYMRSRTQFVPGDGLALDDMHCLAHLPLVAPHHPHVIPTRDGTFYTIGQHPQVFSVVLPILSDALLRSTSYQELEAELHAAPFSAKIAWNLLEQRRQKLHATICGSLAIGDEAPLPDDQSRCELARLGPVDVELRGLFSGNVNVGRLYLRAYPERHDGTNVFHQIQRTLDCRETDLRGRLQSD